MLIPRQERRASRDSEKGREGEVNREEEDRKGGKKEDGEEEEGGKSIDYTVISGSPGNKQQFLEDQVTTSESLLEFYPLSMAIYQLISHFFSSV